LLLLFTLIELGVIYCMTRALKFEPTGKIAFIDFIYNNLIQGS